MKFRYEGHDKMGKPMRGELEAGSVEAASAELREKGVYAMNLEASTEEPMKTVLEHKEEPDPRFVEADPGIVEAEVEKAMNAAEAEAKAEGHAEPSGCCGLTELQSEVIRAVALAREVRDVLRDHGCIEAYCEMMEQAALKEMIAEAAVRRFTQHVRAS